MATNPANHARGGSFLLELLYFAGWQLRVRDGAIPTIHATRADVQLEVSGASLADAAGQSSRGRCVRAVTATVTRRSEHGQKLVAA
jgi:hypothetical protein